MDASLLSISTKKNSSISGSENTNIFELEKANPKELKEKKSNLFKFRRINSLELLDLKNKQRIYAKFNKSKRATEDIVQDKKTNKKCSKLVEDINIVNNKLKCQKNNLINNTKTTNNKEKITSKITNKKKIINFNNEAPLESAISENPINFDYSKKNFCNYIPKRKEMNQPCSKPVCLPTEICLATNHIQNQIGENYILKENIISNDSYKKIYSKGHILLNRFLQQNTKAHSTIIRYQGKNINIVYYK